MNYVLPFFLPLAIFAGITPSVQTYTRTDIIETQDIPSNLVIPQIAVPSPTEPLQEAIPDHLSSCVRHLKTLIPDLPNLDAIDFPINTLEPKVGDIIKFQYYNETTKRYTYHVAIIKEITEDAYEINEANYEAGKETNRTIQKTDEHILGFLNMDRQRLIDALTPIQKETLWNESGWSMYDTKGSVLTGTSEERGVA